MNKIKSFIENKKILSTGIIFGLLSLIGNILCVILINQAHIYDIIHAFPTAIIYEPIINSMGGYVASHFIFVPLAVIMDFVIGLIVGFILKKSTKSEQSYLLGVILSFLVYWILVTYQWLPIL
ncbi:MAG: hypothetical protein RSG52_14995 [Terrisporobacter sp.]|uniref:hypothetical protein n=1 Tax=Terrisporobacter sp. TaxID=1965305 RepID=UPI002FCBEED5